MNFTPLDLPQAEASFSEEEAIVRLLSNQLNVPQRVALGLRLLEIEDEKAREKENMGRVPNAS